MRRVDLIEYDEVMQKGQKCGTFIVIEEYFGSILFALTECKHTFIHMTVRIMYYID